MGYECPVCATPQADARHLANHMAFTALLGDDEHEAWLDEHAPEWDEAGDAELAPRIAEHAPEAEFSQVFEDTAGGLEGADPSDPPEERSGALFEDAGGHDHRHGHGIPRDPDHAGRAAHGDRTAHLAGPGADPDDLDEETREVLEEAREMTREMLAEEDPESHSDPGAGSAEDHPGGDDAAGGAGDRDGDREDDAAGGTDNNA